MFPLLLAAGLAADCPPDPGLLGEYAALERGPADLAPRLAAADARLACTVVPLTPAESAVLHRAHAMAAWLGRDRDEVLAAWAAAVRADPAWTPDPEVVPPGHPLDLLLAQARAAAPTLPEPLPSGRAWIDGVLRVDVPTDAPAVVQPVRGGKVATSLYRWPGDPLPPAPRRAPRVAWGLVGGAAVVSGALWAAALSQLATYEGLADNPADAAERAAAVAAGERANLLGGFATGVTTLAVGATTVAVVVSW